MACKGNGGLAESQWLFLSNASTGLFQKIALQNASGVPYSFKVTQAAAADINNDGVMDLVLADPDQGVQVLLGTSPVSSTSPKFSLAPERLVVTGSLPARVQGVQLIPVADPSVRLELILMGDSTNGFPAWRITGSLDTTVVGKAPGTFFYYHPTYAKAFPITADGSAPWVVTDVFVDSGSYYLNLYRGDIPNQMALAKVDLNLAAETQARLIASTNDGASAQLLPVTSGIVVYDGDCTAQSVATSLSRCRVLFNK